MVLSQDALLGERLGGYSLVAVLGRGGTSVVYRAVPVTPAANAKPASDQGAGPLGAEVTPATAVAVKVLQPPPTATPGALARFSARFRREAQAAMALRHPHILPVLSYGEVEDRAYMVLPLMPGGTLAAFLAAQTGPLPLAQVAVYLRQLAAALDTAHAHGVIHRDVKPANVLIDADGSLRLADFGIARLFDLAPKHDEPVLTTTGEMIGTPAYMAPEQFQGIPAGPAADIYALGIVLYRLVTGCLPFVGGSAVAIGIQHLRDAPPTPRIFRPDLPVPATAAILRVLAKDPAHRFSTSLALAHAFEMGLAGQWTAENTPYPEASWAEQGETLEGDGNGRAPLAAWRAAARITAQLSAAARARWDAERTQQAVAAPAAIHRWLATDRVRLVPVVAWARGPLRERLVTRVRAQRAPLAALMLLVLGLLLLGSAVWAAQGTHASAPSRASFIQSRLLRAREQQVNLHLTQANAGPFVIGYSGATVFAERADGSLAWTFVADGSLVAPPQVTAAVVTFLTARDSIYQLRMSDGALLLRIPRHGHGGNGDGDHGGD